jgi:hypothetical protein
MTRVNAETPINCMLSQFKHRHEYRSDSQQRSSDSPRMQGTKMGTGIEPETWLQAGCYERFSQPCTTYISCLAILHRCAKCLRCHEVRMRSQRATACYRRVIFSFQRCFVEAVKLHRRPIAIISSIIGIYVPILHFGHKDSMPPSVLHIWYHAILICFSFNSLCWNKYTSSVHIINKAKSHVISR